MGSRTTPLPMTPLVSGRRTPQGMSCRTNLLAVDDDGVAGVVAAGVAGDDVELLGEDVDDLAFAFVAPLGTKDYR